MQTTVIVRNSDQRFFLDLPDCVVAGIMDKLSPLVFDCLDSFDDNWSLKIKCSQDSLIITDRCDRTVLTIQCRSLFDVYKKAINIIRDNLILSNSFVLHSSLISLNNHYVLLVGDSGAGKSTLCAYLDFFDNCKCYSDDITFINLDDLKALGLSKFISVRQDVINMIPQRQAYSFNRLTNRYQKPTSPQSTPINIELICFLKRAGFSCMQSVSEKFSILMKNMYLPFSIRNNVKGALALSTMENVFCLNYDSLATAYNSLQSFFDSFQKKNGRTER